MYWIQTFIHGADVEGPSEITQLSVITPGVAWAIDGSSQIWTYSYESEDQPSCWSKPKQLPYHEKALRINSAGDGTVICIASNHKVYRYDKYKNCWIPIENGMLTEVSVGSNCLIYGLGTDNLLYYYHGESHFTQVGVGKYLKLSVGIDDTIFCVGMNKKLYRVITGGAFQTIPTTYTFTTVSVDSASRIMALTTENKILTYIGEGQFNVESNKYYYYDSSNQKWHEKTIPGDYLSMNHDSDGNCYLITQDQRTKKYSMFRMVKGEKPACKMQ